MRMKKGATSTAQAEQPMHEAEDFRCMIADERERAADDSADDGTDERGAPPLGCYGFRLKPIYFALGFLVGRLLTKVIERLLMI